LKNGQLAKPSIKDINLKIAIDNSIMIEDKPLQLDELTE